MRAKVELASLPGATTGAVARAPSFRELFEEHGRYVWRTLRRLGVREADTHDMCQEVFVVVHRKLPEFDGTSSHRTWIYGIALRVASQYRRRAHIRRETVSADLPEQSVPSGQEAALRERRLAERLDAALGRLDEHKRAVFVLYELEELTMSEVAQALGCPLQTAYSRLRAARELIKASFAETEGDTRR